MSNEEVVFFIGTFKAFTEQEYNCERCKKLNSKEVRSNNKACDKKVAKPIHKNFTGIDFYTCPSNFSVDSYAFWFEILRSVQAGSMKTDLDDPNKNFEALQFVERLQSNYQAERIKEANGR